MFAALLSVVSAAMAPSGPVATPVITPPSSPRPLQAYFSPDDYPAAARGTAHKEIVGVALEINPEGRIRACRIILSSGLAVLDMTTCQILARRARLTPARDTASGQAVTGDMVAIIRWQQPRARN